MRVPREVYQVEHLMAAHLPELRPAQRRGLALWVTGAVIADSACQAAVIAAGLPLGLAAHAVRQTLRAWRYDGADRAAPGRRELDVTRCFAPLLRWVVAWWQGTDLALAVDATSLGDRLVGLSVRVVYRGGAIPVAWQVRPATAPGPWMEPILARLARLGPAVPAAWTVLGLTDRGLWSPRRYDRIAALGWHPLRRLQRPATFQPAGQRRRVPARTLGPGPGHAWVGAGVAFKDRPDWRAGTLLVVWEPAAAEPWVLLTTLPPDAVDVCWYGLRAWIELGFRALKSLGWHWERTRRPDPDRVARHWLVLAVATRWVLAYGTRAEDAERRGIPPANLRVAPPPPPPAAARWLSVFHRGIDQVRWQVRRGGGCGPGSGSSPRRGQTPRPPWSSPAS